jgi:hypothetical protein
LWIQASLDHRQRLQQLFFPDGIPFRGKSFDRTAVTACAFRYLKPIEEQERDLVELMGFEPTTP